MSDRRLAERRFHSPGVEGTIHRLVCWLAAVVVFVSAGVAQAATFNTPQGPLPAGCTQQGTTIDCTQDVQLGQGDQWNFTSGSGITLDMNGNSLSLGQQASVNPGGNSADLSVEDASSVTLSQGAELVATVAANGDVSMGQSSSISGDATSSSGSINVGEKSSVGGALTADAAVTLQKDSQVAGSVSAGGDVSMGQSSSISGAVTSSGGSVTVGEKASVAGSLSADAAVTLQKEGNVAGPVSAGGDVSMGQSSAISGDVTSSGGSVTVGEKSNVGGALSAAAAVTVQKEASVTGGVTAGGDVSTGKSSSVGGDLTSTGGSVTVGENGSIGGALSADGAATIQKEGTVAGEVTAGGDASLGQDGLVQGDVQTGGDLTVQQGAVIEGCVTVGGTLSNNGLIKCSEFIGSGTGLTGAYCNRPDRSGARNNVCDTNPDVERIDSTVAFSTGDPGWPPSGIGEDTYNVRWTGQIQAQWSEDYTFHALHDDGVRIWVDGTQVIDRYSDQDDSWTDSGTPISLQRGQKYEIVIEWYENQGDQDMTLAWSSASTAFRTTVPQTQLYPDSAPPPAPGGDLLLEWRMDESGWSGTPGEVADASGNNRAGTAEGGADTAGAPRAIPGDPGTCRYGDLSGGGQYVLDDNAGDYLNGRNAITVTAWVRNTASTPVDAGIFNTGPTIGQDNNLAIRYDAAGASSGSTAGLKASLNTDQCASGQDCIQVETDSGLQVQDQWQHVAMTWSSGDKIRIYIDGFEVQTTVVNGSGNLTGTIDDVDFLRVGQSSKGGEDWQGWIDEFRVYADALSASEIATVRDAAHDCATAGPVAWQQLDEPAYDGSSGEVTDASGNGNAGRTVGRVDNVDPAQVCAGAAAKNNNQVSQFDAIDTGLDVNGQLGAQGAVNFWFQAGKDWGKLKDQMLFDASTTADGGKYFYMTLHDASNNQGARIGFGLEDTDDDDFRFATQRLEFAKDEWVHLGATWDLDGGEMQVFVNGSLEDSWTINAASAFGDLDTLYFGDNRSGYIVSPMNGQTANGAFDEIRAYDGVIDAGQMVADRDATHPCPGAGPDRYAIDVGANPASTCEARTITITAEDSSGNAVTDYTEAVSITTSSGHGTWTANAADGTLTDNTADDGAADYGFFSSDNGTIALDLANQHADDLTITVTESGGSPSSTSTTLSFRDNAFVIDSIDSLADDVVAGRDHALRATLWRRDSGGDCGIADAYDSATRGAKVWVQRHADDPGGSGPQLAQQIGGGDLPDSEPGSNNVELDFSAATLGQAGRAPLTLETDDVGKYALSIVDDTSGFAVDAAGNPRRIAGGSSDYVVRPFGLRVAAAGNPGAANAGGTAYRAAGMDFDVTVAGVQYQAGDDDGGEGGTAGDGVPDGHTDADAATGEADLGDNAITASFGQEGTNETVVLTSRLVAPTAGRNPGLAGGEPIGFSSFAGGSDGDGAATRSIAWPEVGIIELEARLADYLGSGRNLHGRSGEVGRFTPADFEVSQRDPGIYAATCNAAFSYVGRAFGYAARPRLDITARNASEVTTENYRGNFIQLTTGGVALLRPTQDASAVSNVDGDIDVAVTSSAGSNDALADADAGDAVGNGRLVYTLPDDDTYTYNKVHNARIAPFTADLPITLDGVTDDDGVTADGADSIAAFTPTGVQLRFGRLIIGDAYGPEVAPVEQRWRIETWRGTNWATEAADGCTALALAGDVQLAGDGGTSAGNTTVTLNDGIGATEITSGAVGFTAGTATVAYDATGAGNRGWISVATALGTNHHLLVDDNDDGGNDGPYNVEPSARVTFGVFAGQQQQIYLREVFPAP